MRVTIRVGNTHGSASTSGSSTVRFLPETLSNSLVCQSAGGEYFEGHVAIQLFVARPVNLSHSAGANFVYDAVVAESLINHAALGPGVYTSLASRVTTSGGAV